MALSEGRSQRWVAEYLYNAPRNPYVGDGADGCLRSARIDQEQADLLDIADPRRPDADGEEVRSVGHDQDRRDDSRRDRRDDRPTSRLVLSSHVPRVDWIHNTDLGRLLEGEPEPPL